MRKLINKKTLLILAIVVWGLLIYIVLKHYIKPETVVEDINVSITLKSENAGMMQLFYTEDSQVHDGCFSEDKKLETEIAADCISTIRYAITQKENIIRIDFPSVADNAIVISDIIFESGSSKLEISQDMLDNMTLMVNQLEVNEGLLDSTLRSSGDDAFLVLNIHELKGQLERKAVPTANILSAVLTIIAVTAVIVLMYLSRTDFYNFVKDIVNNRKLLSNLAKNDLKSRFAGSYLGVVWSFIQPIVTVFVYWFVFQIGLRNSSVVTINGDVPYVLWFVAGLVPWFFYSDAWNTATNVLVEYSYLVKKVVFNIDILPLVKMLSGLIVHVFFVAFMLLMYILYGKFPGISAIQVIYYTFCMFVLVLGHAYLTCSCVLFFRDLSQIINIWMQMGIWMTPIMWNIDTIELASWLKVVFKLNPMFYVVQGYRDSLINQIGFWNRFGDTVYFWSFTIIMFVAGRLIFKKLKPHFADVL